VEVHRVGRPRAMAGAANEVNAADRRSARLQRGVDFRAVLDGQLVFADETSISIQDEGFLRGDGAFEVFIVYLGRPFAAAAHLDRLEASCAALRLACPRSLVEHDLLQLLQASGRATYAVRIVLTRGGRRIVIAEAWEAPSTPTRLAFIVNQQQPLLAGVKSLSYAGNMLSKRLAREHSADDALWVSPDGRVLEAQTAAFFWVSSTGALLTPPLSEGILDSITRRLVIQHLDVQERSSHCQDALSCTEAFLAGTTKEIQPVFSIEGRELPLAPGPVTQRAAEFYRDLVARRVAGSRVIVSGKDGRMSDKAVD
jgi:branched-chain amino acid aminotransferase